MTDAADHRQDLDDATVLLPLLQQVARVQDGPRAANARQLMRRGLELMWEKPRETGPAYGQFRLGHLWSPRAKARVRANLSVPGYSGDRGLIKEHVVPYKQLVARLIADCDRFADPALLAAALRNGTTIAVITKEEDGLLSNIVPAAWDFTDPDETWLRYDRTLGHPDPDQRLDRSTFSPFDDFTDQEEDDDPVA